MSWKGLTKTVTRAPQTFKQRFNLGEITKDPIYIDAERRFQELEKETKKLHEESKKYFEAINGMLSHQMEFSKAIAEIYKPISGRMSDPDSFHDEGNTAGIEACEEYESVVKELQETLKPELEMIESRVIRPADELLVIIKAVRKIAAKRDHKQLDYDRHRATYKKLEEKKDKTLKDEKAMYKAENDVELATQDYNYFNDLLKDELPKLFALEREFIKPLFQSFYYMQLNVFYTLHERMQRLDIGYFDLTLDIEAAYQKKRGDTQEEAEKISIVKFKTTGGARVAGARPGQSKYATKALEAKAGRSSISEDTETPPPPYSAGPSAAAVGDVKSPTLSTGSWGSAAKAKGAPPPPKPKPSRLSGVPATETVTALYDYEAQAEGDLSFLTGDVIEIVSRTQNDNEWWIGKVRGKQGQFPALEAYRTANPDSPATFTLKLAPYQLYPDATQEGVDKYEWYKNEKYQGSEERMKMYMAAMEDLGKAENIKFDFGGGMLANTLHAHRVLQYLQNNKEQGLQLEVLKSLYTQYFEQRAHPSSTETLKKACVAAGISQDEAEKLVEDGDEELRETKAAIQEQAGNGVDSVPYVIFEGRKRDFTLIGAKSVAEYEKALGQVAKECA